MSEPNEDNLPQGRDHRNKNKNPRYDDDTKRYDKPKHAKLTPYKRTKLIDPRDYYGE